MDNTQEISLVVAVVLLVGTGIITGISANTRKVDAELGQAPKQRKRRKIGSRPMKPKLKELDAGILRAEIATRLIAGADIASAWEVISRRLHPDLDFAAAKVFVESPRENRRHRFRG